jgi:hypothetical protein
MGCVTQTKEARYAANLKARAHLRDLEAVDYVGYNAWRYEK